MLLTYTQLGQRLRQSESLLAIVGLRRVKERLWQLLQLLKQEMGQSIGEGNRLTYLKVRFFVSCIQRKSLRFFSILSSFCHKT